MTICLPLDSETDVFDVINSTSGGGSLSIIVKTCFLAEPVFAFVTVESMRSIIICSSYSSILSSLIFNGNVILDFPAGTKIASLMFV